MADKSADFYRPDTSWWLNVSAPKDTLFVTLTQRGHLMKLYYVRQGGHENSEAR